MNVNFNIPDIQRSLDNEHVQKIYDFENNYYLKHNTYCIAGSLSIGIKDNDSSEYILDGQHRIYAYMKLIENFPERKLLVTIDYYTLIILMKYIN